MSKLKSDADQRRFSSFQKGGLLVLHQPLFGAVFVVKIF